MIDTNTTNTFSYTGILRAKIKNKDNTFYLEFHNSGTKMLFDLVAKALTGASIADKIPRFLDIEIKDDSGEYRSALLSLIPLTGAVYGDALSGALDSDGRCTFTAYFTNDVKGPFELDNKLTSRLSLKNMDKQVLAWIEDENISTLWNLVTEQSESILKWTLIFENKVEEI